MRLGKLLQLYIGVNDIKKADLAKEIGIETFAINRLLRGRDVTGRDLAWIMLWLTDSKRKK